jgi:GT2 family glycosyltransferase
MDQLANADTLHVAVVIVSYKSARLTIDSLAAIEADRNPTGPAIHAFVVDNASGDFPEIARTVERNHWSDWVTVLEAPVNGGFAYGNNRGMERACATGSPDYFYLVNPDAQVRTGAIAALVDFLELHPQAGIAGSSFENFDGSDWPIAFRFPGLLSELISGLEFGPVSRLLQRWTVAREMDKIPQPVDWICGASMMIRSEVLSSMGGLDENYFLYFEETDFCYRASQAGFATWYVPESRVMHIRGQSTEVTDLTKGIRRLPAYWFESRRRFFARTYGLRKAVMIDLVAVLANSLGLLKRILLMRSRTAIPHFIRDLLRHSVLWPRNQKLPAVRCFRAPRP